MVNKWLISANELWVDSSRKGQNRVWLMDVD